MLVEKRPWGLIKMFLGKKKSACSSKNSVDCQYVSEENVETTMDRNENVIAGT